MKSYFCLCSPNIQSEIGEHGSAIGCSADLTPKGRNISIRAVCNALLGSVLNMFKVNYYATYDGIYIYVLFIVWAARIVQSVTHLASD